MNSGEDALKLIAGIVLTILVISIAFTIYKKASSASDIATDEIDQLTGAMTTERYAAYEGNNISGSTVTGAISEFQNDAFCVRVNNGKQTVEYGKKSTDLTQPADGLLIDAKDKAKVSTVYIYPADYYTGELIYDDNKTASEGSTGTIIIGLQFTKN